MMCTWSKHRNYIFVLHQADVQLAPTFQSYVLWKVVMRSKHPGKKCLGWVGAEGQQVQEGRLGFTLDRPRISFNFYEARLFLNSWSILSKPYSLVTFKHLLVKKLWGDVRYKTITVRSQAGRPARYRRLEHTPLSRTSLDVASGSSTIITQK